MLNICNSADWLSEMPKNVTHSIATEHTVIYHDLLCLQARAEAHFCCSAY